MGKEMDSFRHAIKSKDDKKIKDKTIKNDDEKFNKELKEIEENYESHLDEILPDYLHRGDIFSNSRMLGYIDAMMATCATFLVIPLRNLKELKENQSLADFSNDHRTEYIMFFIGFLVVLGQWESINIRAFAVKRMDDILVLLMMIQLLATTGLPFSLALQGHYQNESTPVIITCCLLVLFEITEIISAFYAAATPRVLHIAMHSWSKDERSTFRNLIILKNLASIVIVGFGAALYAIHYSAAWVFMALLIITPLMRRIFFFLRRRYVSRSRMEQCRFFYAYSKGNVSKERVEVMSDAATAIIACVLILDITVEEFPTIEKVLIHGLNHELDHMKKEFYAFLLTYGNVSLLWYANHSVLHLFRSVNTTLLFCQKFFLAFACVTPRISNMVTTFESAGTEDTNYSIQAGSFCIFFSSTANLLMLAYGLYRKDKYLHPWAQGSCLAVNMRQHIYTVLKTVSMPFWSIICLLGTTGSPEVARYFLYICIIGNVGTFILLKIIFLNHVGQEVRDPATGTWKQVKAYKKVEKKPYDDAVKQDGYIDQEADGLRREQEMADSKDIIDAKENDDDVYGVVNESYETAM